jgi:hypothetical protein
MDERNAPHFPSLADMRRTIEQAVKAMQLAGRGLLPFKYSFKFDGREGETVGPMTGVVWAKDEQDARRYIAIDVNGHCFGYEITVEVLPFTPW